MVGAVCIGQQLCGNAGGVNWPGRVVTLQQKPNGRKGVVYAAALHTVWVLHGGIQVIRKFLFCFSHIVQQPGKLSGFLQPKRQQPLAGVACNGFIMGLDGLHRLLMILHPNMGRKDTIHGTPPLLQ